MTPLTFPIPEKAMFRVVSLVVLLLAGTSSAFAGPVSIHTTDPVLEYLRLMQIRGQLETEASWNLQPLRYEWLEPKEPREIHHAHPWEERILRTGFRPGSEWTWHLYSPRFYQSVNSEFPSGMNDGALWQGRGYNTSFTLGAVVRWRFLEAALRPEFGYSQNRDFALSPFDVREDLSEYSHPFRRIVDLPQRFGEDPLSWADPGNSYIKAIAGPVALGFSNEHHWFGPAWFNPIIMSNHAPGFRHGYLETSRPLATPIGFFESRIYWGALHDSGYFYREKESETRYLTGLMVNYSPSFLENVHVSAVRTFYEYWPEDGLKARDLVRLFEPFYKISFMSEENPSGSDEASQMISLMLRWVFPTYGSEVYAEFARNDHALDYRDLVMEPEHATAFTLGAVATRDVGTRRFLTFHFELTQLEGRKTMLYRGGYYRLAPYYTDNRVREGYSQAGQVLGAGIGPGSSSQYFGTTLYDRRGRIGLFLRRQVNDNDNLLENLGMIREAQGYPGARSWRGFHDVEMQVGMLGTLFLNDFEVDLTLVRSNNYNRNYIRDSDFINYHVSLTLRCHPYGFLR